MKFTELGKQDEKHLPIYGPGPFFGGTVIGVTLAVFLMRNAPLFAFGRRNGGGYILLMILGALCVMAGIALWIYAVPISKIDDGILHNYLVTTGAYALVRNPIYSAIMIACTGVLLIAGNICFLPLPFVYWIYMTVLLKNTEEKWLRNLYGQVYDDYCKSVNRCWPWIPKRHK
jgi:protein-S-isoprenylcysteine O-methyltransferase Ste14